MIDQLLKMQAINVDLLAKVVDMRIELDALQALVKTIPTDLKELQDTTGITFERWKATRKEQNLLYIQNRIEYHRSQGESLMGAKKMAVKDLRELHQRELLSQ